MSLINEALKRARVDAAAEQAGPRMDLRAVVATETRRGGVKVTSLLFATVIALSISVVALLLIGGSAKPQSAGAIVAGESNENTGAVGADGLDREDVGGKLIGDAHEKADPIGVTIAQADVGKDAAAARSVEQMLKDFSPTIDDFVDPVTGAPVDNAGLLVTKPESKLEVQPDPASVGAPVGALGATPVAAPKPDNSNEQTAALIAAVVRALEADRAKQAKENEAKAKEAEAKEQVPADSTAKHDQSLKPIEPAAPVAVESRFPTFVGEVADERFPYLKISGMSRSNDQQCVLINKKILLLGDTIDNVMVERIERKRVRLKYNGQVFFLELP